MIAALLREVVAGHLGAELALGSGLLLLTAFVHGIGVAVVLWTHERQLLRAATHRATHAVGSLAAMVVVLIAVHLVEIFLWALLFREIGAIAGLRDAFYFSTVTYTTLGYQDVPFPKEYRILPGMLALAGVFMMGWTTGVLFAVTNGYIQTHVRQRLEREQARARR